MTFTLEMGEQVCLVFFKDAPVLWHILGVGNRTKISDHNCQRHSINFPPIEYCCIKTKQKNNCWGSEVVQDWWV